MVNTPNFPVSLPAPNPVRERKRPLMQTTSSKTPAQDRQNALAQYFHEMSGRGLLDAQGEAKLASSLRDTEEELWQVVLSHAAFVTPVTEFLNESLSDKKQLNVRSLRTAATRFLKSPSAKTQASLAKSALKAAAQVRDFDPDQEVLVALLEALDEGLAGLSDAPEYAAYREKIATLQTKANHIRNKFVECNLGLVVSVARRYQFSGMALADLIQEGNLGLLKAVARFDDRRGFRFSSYATWWIRHAIGRAVADKSRTVRVPVHVTESNQKIKKITLELAAELGRDPTREEIAKVAEMSVRKLESTISSAQGYSMSLDAPLGEDGDRERMEVFTTDTKDSAFEQMASLALTERATKAMDSLAPLEVEILNRRFGLAGKTATTLQEIANTIGKSRERIRQIQEKALLKLREHLVAEHAV
jgi:RNA polymerase primary sigma factor